MNILILGTAKVEQKFIKLCLKSKFLDHIYTASKESLKNIPNIEYNSFEELVRKAKALQIDLVLVSDKELVQNGIVEYLNNYRINVISVNKKWLNLESQRLVAKQLMNYYSINNPQPIKAPIAFPLVVKSVKRKFTKIVYNMMELVEIKENYSNDSIFLEEYMKGESISLLSLWDGKSLLSFPVENSLTEVQVDRLDLYKTKLNIMFSDECPDFIGFFISKLIWAKNDWHVLDYIMRVDLEVDLNNVIQKDFLYILNLAIFQKLNEISY